MRIDKLPEIPKWYIARNPVPKRMLNKRDPMFDFTPIEMLVEVGSCYGWFAFRAASQLPNASIYCVDPWSEDPRSVYGNGRENFWDWCLNLENFLGRVVGLRGVSEDFAEDFADGSVDLCFIDGDHRAECVRSDCEIWWPKIRPGGYLVGHDIDGPWGEDVRRGVVESIGERFGISACYWGMAKGKRLGRCWYVKK